MVGFLPEGAVNRSTAYNGIFPQFDLEKAVGGLSVKAKQAMYAVLKSGGVMRRRTWNGCAFNKAGGVHGSVEAARMFEMQQRDVERFIHAWDSLSFANDGAASRHLMALLEKVGICTPPRANHPSAGLTRIVSGYEYKSQATKFKEELESGELTVDMIPGCEEAAKLLCNA